MERGQLAPSGVSSRVLEALGSILGASVERLREAGAAGEVAAADGGEVFARLGAPEKEKDTSTVVSAEERSDLAAEPDELDLLFIGGD
jgi:putative intracellular protease/amidase